MPNPIMETLTVGNNTYDINDARVGDLSDLTTTAKSTVVDAINEVAGGAIASPAGPSNGQYLMWNGSAWVAQSLPVYNGGVS